MRGIGGVTTETEATGDREAAAEGAIAVEGMGAGRGRGRSGEARAEAGPGQDDERQLAVEAAVNVAETMMWCGKGGGETPQLK